MQGTVIKVMRRGFVAKGDSLPELGDQVQLYRVVDGVETILGTGYVRKFMMGGFKVNPPDTDKGDRGEQYADVRDGDLVRSIP